MASERILQCEALLFDLDGVLVDSTACVEATWRRWAANHALDPAEVLAVAHGRRTIDTIRHVAPHLAVEDEVAALVLSESSTTEGVYEVPGARAMLEHLPVRQWAIVTSGIRRVAMLRIAHTHLPLPSVIVTADDISRGKPDPEGYVTGARQLGVRPEACIVVEDAPAGLDAAHAAGMRSVGIGSTYPCEALRAATVCITSLDMLQVSSAPGALSIELRVAQPNDSCR